MHRILHPFRQQREGQTLAVFAVMIVALLAMMSLAIDLGMAFTARSEAQRVADAAALAGASVFMDLPEPADVGAAAEARAREYARLNVVRNRPVADEDVEVQVLLNQARVRVWIRRDGLPAWFSRFLGRDGLAVRAMAAAEATTDGSTDCLKPWAVLDAFLEHDGTPPAANAPYNPNIHYYEPARARCGTGTGYGAATARDNSCDFGLEFVIKANNPNDPAVPTPGIFMPVRLPADKNQGQCHTGGGGPYERNICSCNNTSISIGDWVSAEPGNMSGPTMKGVDDLYKQDPSATWGPDGVVSEFGNGSPRVAKMILISPDAVYRSGMQQWEVMNFGQFFIEEFWEEGKGNEKIAHVRGRFMYYMSGTGMGQGSATSPLVRTLRLVE
jgi:hypothetical protein